MNHHQWSQRLRGHINLKTCVALGAIAITGASVVALHAQGKPTLVPSDKVAPQGAAEFKSNAPDSTRIKYPLQHGYLISGSTVPREDQGPHGVTLVAGRKDSAITLGAKLTGSFVDLKTNTVVNETLTVNDAPNRSLIKGENYHLSVAVLSLKTPLYGLTIGSTKQRAAEEDDPKIVRVALSNPAKIIHIESDIDAENLLAPSEQWTVATKPVPLQSRTVAKQEITKNGARVRGTISGDFADLSDNDDPSVPFVTKTLDIFKLDDGGVGLIGDNYELTTTFAAPDVKSKIAFAAWGAGGGVSAQPILMVDVDAAQNWLLLQGVVTGQKFPKTGLGWSVRNRPYFDVPATLRNSLQKETGFTKPRLWGDDTLRVADRGSSDHENLSALPALENNGRIYFQSQAQVVPPAPPSPTATPIVVTPNTNGGSDFNISLKPSVGGVSVVAELHGHLPYINFGIFSVGTKARPTGSTLTFEHKQDQHTYLLKESKVSTCGGAQKVSVVAAVGLEVKAEIKVAPGTSQKKINKAIKNATNAFNANDLWRTQANPEVKLLGATKKWLADVEKGHQNVPYQWNQDVTLQSGTVTIHYSDESSRPVPVSILTYIEPDPSIGEGDACPVQPVSHDTEDDIYTGHQTYLASPPLKANGTVTPTPAPNP